MPVQRSVDRWPGLRSVSAGRVAAIVISLEIAGSVFLVIAVLARWG